MLSVARISSEHYATDMLCR